MFNFLCLDIHYICVILLLNNFVEALKNFPGCEDVYFNGNDLCKLKILMESLDFGVELKEWEPQCRDITEAYFDDLDSSFSTSNIISSPHFIIGVTIGAAVALILMLIIQSKHYLCKKCLFVFQYIRWRKYESLQ